MSYKKFILATVLVFLSFFITDSILHGNILMSAYIETAELWRPQNEMTMPLMQLSNLLIAAAISSSYAYFVSSKTLKNTLLYTGAIGFVMGISTGYITYATMPITIFIANVWFFGIITQKLIAGLILYFIYKKR